MDKIHLQDVSDENSPGPQDAVLIVRLLVTGVGPYNKSNPSITFRKSTNLLWNYGAIILSTGTIYPAIKVEPGTYSWKYLIAGGLTGDVPNEHPFTVVAGRGNYVGDLLLDVDLTTKKFRMGIGNREELVRGQYNVQYPNIAQTHPFTVAMMAST